jgi:FkbM family methyltransferase
MDHAMQNLVIAAVVALAIAQGAIIVLLRRLTRRVKRRRLLIGPEDHIRLQKQLYDHLARADLAATGVVPRLPVEFRSEWGEDTLLYELFRGQRSGVFVEVGALDGVRCSVSYLFEAIGWSGVLVEPIPEQHAACVRNRPGANVFHAALGPAGSSGTTTFMVPVRTEHQPSGYRPHEGMGTGHLAVLAKAGAQMRAVAVPLTTMDDVLTRAGVERVDWAVIDVEGGELDVLRGFDLKRFRPRVLVIEDNSLGNDRRIGELLGAAGYDQVLWIGANRVLIARSDAELLTRARRLAETVYSPFVRPAGLHDTDPRLDAAAR